MFEYLLHNLKFEKRITKLNIIMRIGTELKNPGINNLKIQFILVIIVKLFIINTSLILRYNQ